MVKSKKQAQPPAPPLPPWQRLHKPVAPAKTEEEIAAEQAAEAVSAAAKNSPDADAVDVPTNHPSKGPPDETKKSGSGSDEPPATADDSDSDDEPTLGFKAVKCPRKSGPAEAYAKREEGGASKNEASADDIDALANAVAESSETTDVAAAATDDGVAAKKPSKKKAAKSKTPPKKKSTTPKQTAKKTAAAKPAAKKAAAKKPAADEEETASSPQRSSRRQRTQVVPFTITDAAEEPASPAKKSAKESKKRKAAEQPAAKSKAKKVGKKDPPLPPLPPLNNEDVAAALGAQDDDTKDEYLPPISPRVHHVTAKMEATWAERIKMLKAHQAKYGTVDLTVAEKKDVSQLLRSFVYEQRKQYKKYMSGGQSSLTAERIKELSDLGFEFNPVASGTQKANSMRRFQEQWDAMYDELVAFKNEHGHTLVPLGKSAKVEYKKLGNWVRGQRKQMNKVGRDEFDPHRMTKLDAIGFDWNPLSSGTYTAKKRADLFPRVNVKWMSWYNKLKDFKEKNGHIIVGPKTQDCPGLYNWIHGQRKEYVKYQNKEPNVNMYEEWITKLNDLGFDWAPMSKGGSFNDMLKKRTSKLFDNKWDANYQQLCKFHEENGHCYVFRTGDDATLAGWVHTQRKQKKLLDDGKHSSLNPQRIELLDKIGFDWRPSESGGIEKLKSPERNLGWDQLFEKLKEYKEETGDCSPKKKVPKIGNWVSSQRRLWARNQKGETTTLTEERIAKLQSIGFDFSPAHDESAATEDANFPVYEETEL